MAISFEKYPMRNPNIDVFGKVYFAVREKTPTMITYRTWPVNKNSAFRTIIKGFSGMGLLPPETADDEVGAPIARLQQ
jgi:hypothetical protein